MTDYRRPPLEGLFQNKNNEGDSDSLLPVKQQIENFEMKTKLNFNKSRPAPPPPGSQIQLPKIGNYQPKILLRKKSDKRDESPTKEPEKTSYYGPYPKKEFSGNYSRHLNRSNSVESGNSSMPYKQLIENEDTSKKVMIIGDKDTPITVHDSESHPEDLTNHYYSPYGTENPMFQTDVQAKQDSEPTEKDTILDFNDISKNLAIENGFHDDKENIDQNNVKNNPLFGREFSIETDREDSGPLKSPKTRPAPLPPSDLSNPHNGSYPLPSPGNDVDNQSDEPYIPAPDYDEDEATMTVNEYDEIPGKRPSENRRSAAFTNFVGEDYSEYLSDDEDYFSDHTFTWRKNIQYRRKGASGSGKPRPMSHPQKHMSRDKPKKQGHLKPVGKVKREAKLENVKRNTIRDFSFSDSKIGFGDRTVKSTSAKGRYEKRNKDRPRIEGSEGSYEEFLRMRQNENGSSSSADSGTVGDMYNMNIDVFAQSQPKPVRDKKGSMWQRLTWKFKRHSAYQLG